jgi:hypothetical protein
MHGLQWDYSFPRSPHGDNIQYKVLKIYVIKILIKLLLLRIKAKVKLSLCLVKYHAMKTYGGVEEYLHTFLMSELDRGER